MVHPATRMLAVLEILQARGRVSGAELARRLEVSRRTVRRYVTMLQDMGIPVEASHGPYGGYRLGAGYRLPPLMLDDDEAVALTLALVAARRRGLAGMATALERALAKVQRSLPDTLRERLQAAEASLTSGPGRPGAPPDPEVLLALGQAVEERRRVSPR